MKGYALSVSGGFVDTGNLKSHPHPNLSPDRQKYICKYSINPKHTVWRKEHGQIGGCVLARVRPGDPEVSRPYQEEFCFN